MAKTHGPLHTDAVSGSLAGVTHRLYRGTQVASVHKMATALPVRVSKINSPLDLPSLFSRHTLGKGVILTPPPAPQYVIAIDDQKGGFGKLENLTPGAQPRIYPSDPAHNNRPYCYFDGTNDRIRTDILAIPLEQPFEVWTVQSGSLKPSSDFMPFIGFKDGEPFEFSAATLVTLEHRLRMFLIQPISDLHDDVIFLNRLVVDGANSFCEWNGAPQYPPSNTGSGNFDRLMLANRWGVNYARFNLFEIDVFSGILNPVERQLLINWFFQFYNLP